MQFIRGSDIIKSSFCRTVVWGFSKLGVFVFRILGSKSRLCDGVTRRDLLRIGGLGAFGFGVADWLRLREAQASAALASRTFGQAKACILVFLTGSPPQHETFDPKPQASAEIQGEMQPIPTNVPGLHICERLPRHATIMDRVTVVRSMTHPYPLHGVGYATSAMPLQSAELNSLPKDSRQRPFIGSVVDFLEEQKTGVRFSGIPTNIGLPWLFGVKSDKYGAGTKRLSGPYASFLGSDYDPLWTDFDGKGTKIVPKLNATTQRDDVYDPFAGVEASGKFRLGASCQFLPSMTRHRFDSRRFLLEQFDQARSGLNSHQEARNYDKHQSRAYSLLTTSKMREAIDIQREPTKVREAYGMTLFGQSLLAARRLVEAGSKFVSVFWDPYGPFGASCWDTHSNHFPRLKDYLLPVYDESFPSFILDLDERGMLDETAVLCISEHGRTPKIDSKPQGAARHHWSRAYSAVYAGGGFSRGKVVGETDAIGGDVESTPVSPKDVLATTFHLLGIDPYTTIPDHLDRPQFIAGDGKVRPELLG